jgi:hypothetical protein
VDKEKSRRVTESEAQAWLSGDGRAIGRCRGADGAREVGKLEDLRFGWMGWFSWRL